MTTHIKRSDSFNALIRWCGCVHGLCIIVWVVERDTASNILHVGVKPILYIFVSTINVTTTVDIIFCRGGCLHNNNTV